MASPRFAAEHLGRSDALGEIDPQRLNVNGGRDRAGTSGRRDGKLESS